MRPRQRFGWTTSFSTSKEPNGDKGHLPLSPRTCGVRDASGTNCDDKTLVHLEYARGNKEHQRE